VAGESSDSSLPQDVTSAATAMVTMSPNIIAGLAPFNHDSGRKRGQRQIRGGRKRVRDALYMAALAAARSRSAFATFYKALRQAGKPPKLALIALARKILTVLNAMLRDQKPFQTAKP